MSKRCAKCEKPVYPIEELKCLDKVRRNQKVNSTFENNRQFSLYYTFFRSYELAYFYFPIIGGNTHTQA